MNFAILVILTRENDWMLHPSGEFGWLEVVVKEINEGVTKNKSGLRYEVKEKHF